MPTTRASPSDAPRFSHEPTYPALHSFNFIDHSAASRLHARFVSHRVHTLVRKKISSGNTAVGNGKPVAIDATGQNAINKDLRKSDTPARRVQPSSTHARPTVVRRTVGHVGHGLVGFSNDPPAQSAAPVGTIQFVPRKDVPSSLMTGDEEWPPDGDDPKVDARLPSSENARTSPPLGASLFLSSTSGVGHMCRNLVVGFNAVRTTTRGLSATSWE